MLKTITCLVLLSIVIPVRAETSPPPAPVQTAAPAQPLPAPAPVVPAPPAVNGKAWLLVDFHSGQVLAENNADQRLEPASLTKMMTIYSVARVIGEGKVKLSDQVPISEKAWKMGGSRMFVEVGNRVLLEDLMKGDIVQSGNDASVALAEYISGSEEVFAAQMSQNAAQIGMNNTNFVNSTGLPDANHYTTARDLATLAVALIRDYPEIYKWFSLREFTYNGITQPNRNKLLARDSSVDGIKTGYHEAAGYCLAASAERDGMRLVAVVLGSQNEQARADAAQALLGYGFRFYETRKFYGNGQPVHQLKVWKGIRQQVDLVVTGGDIQITIPRGQVDRVQAEVETAGDLEAPVASGEERGRLKISYDGKPLASRPLATGQAVPAAGIVGRSVDTVKRWFE
jgi:D-alanyl-D-alanine carboxypeptidase (penicillin-binding protein 5/6)